MIVAYYMTKKLITTTKDTKIYDAVDLMKQYNIHRLPVVEGGKVIGLITEGTIQEALPSKATSLSVYEVNYLLNKTTVADIMIKEVQTIDPDAMLEEAISKMRENNVGVLPVVSKSGELVGIITNNDIFDAFLEITGYNEDGLRISIGIEEDHQGILADIAQLFAKNQLNIVQIVVYRHEKSQPIIVIQTGSSTDEEKVTEMLKAANYQVLSCVKTEKISE